MFEETSLAKHSQKANAEAAFTTISSYWLWDLHTEEKHTMELLALIFN